MAQYKLNTCTCGGKPKLKRGIPSLNYSKDVWAMVQCFDCNKRTKTYHATEKHQTFAMMAQKAADEWNSLNKM